MKFIDEPISYNFDTDEIVKEVDEPTFMTDRKREELRINKSGIYYLHTNNDRESETIYTGIEVKIWAEEHNIKL